MTTASASEVEAQHRARLDDIKHRHYVAKREHQIERMGARIDLLVHRVQQLRAQTKADLAEKLGTLEREVAAVKATAGATSKARREAANAAWKDLRESFSAAYETAGLAQAKREDEAAAWSIRSVPEIDVRVTQPIMHLRGKQHD